MANYLWSAKDAQAHIINGYSRAPNPYLLNLLLAQQGLSLTACFVIRPWHKRCKLPNPAMRLQLLQQWQRLLAARLPMLDVVRLSVPLKAETPVRWQLRCFGQLLQQGSQFSAAIGQLKLLPEVDVALLTAAEEGGFLAPMLQQLVQQQQAKQQLQRHIKRSLVMPGITLLVGLMVAVLLLLWLVPTMATMMAGQVGELPAITQMLLQLSYWLQQWGTAMSLGLLGIGLLLWRALKLPSFARYLHNVLLYVPVFGVIISQQQQWRLYQLIGAGMQGGVTLLRCLQLFLPSCQGAQFHCRVSALAEDLLAGDNLVKAFTKAGLPEQQLVMLNMGQHTGQLGDVCMHIAKDLEQQMRERLEHLKNLLEPIITIFLATVVGGLVLAIYLPLLQLGTMLR